MNFKNYLVGAIFLLPIPAMAQQAQFCSVGQYDGSMDCNHLTLAQCQSAARLAGGQCVIRDAGQNRSSGFADSFMQGQRIGQQAKESQARIKLMEAQTQALQRQSSGPEYNGKVLGYWILFKCPTQDGGVVYTGEPAVGCTVVNLTSY